MFKKRSFLNLFSLTLLLFVWGCKGQTGPAGAAGATGLDGSDAPTNLYTAVFTTGVSPTASYTGTTMNWVDSANPATIYQNAGRVYFNTAGQVSAVLLKFDLSGVLPTNATIRSAALEIVATSGTSLGGSVTVGVHEMKVTGCPWTANATWNTEDGSLSWSGCSGTGDFNTATFNSSMGTAVLTTSYNGGTNRIGLSVSTSTINDWLAGNNNGLAVVSENMGSDTAGVAIFASPTNADVNIRPTLKVNYTL